jgi:hypothetical protein
MLPDFQKSIDFCNVPRISPFIDKDTSELFLKSKFVPHSKQRRRSYKNNQLILYDKIMAVFM